MQATAVSANSNVGCSSTSMCQRQSSTVDSYWVNRYQQYYQHPQYRHLSPHFHPLKNTIRTMSNGQRFKFDGKQWRSLCQSKDGHECRNMAFRSSLCQKHFYKMHLLRRSAAKLNEKSSSEVDSSSTKQTEIDEDFDDPQIESSDDSDSIQYLERENVSTSTSLNNMSIDSPNRSDNEKTDSECRALKKFKLTDLTFDKKEKLNELDKNPTQNTVPKVIESIRLGLPPLTRTEEKSLAQELINQLSHETNLNTAEHLARRRAAEIVLDNYSQQIVPSNINPEWFYDFLLRNPRVPIHFQSWFSSVRSTMPSSDHPIEIKLWELKLITTSVGHSYLSTSNSFEIV